MRIALLVLLAAAVTGCGFKLRDEVALPAALKTLRIDSPDPYSALERELDAALDARPRGRSRAPARASSTTPRAWRSCGSRSTPW
jgi:hypothetical protein